MSELPPNTVWRENGDWFCDPEIVARHLGLTPEAFRSALRDGTLGATVERGEGEDAGRTRLTYRYGDRAWSICVEPDGRIVEVAPPVTQGAALDWLLGRRPQLLWRGHEGAGPPAGDRSPSED